MTLVLNAATAAFGAIGATGRAANSGAAYVFEMRHGVWVQAARLVADDGVPRQGFGSSIALTRDTLVVGAPGAGADGQSTGAAYVFERVKGVWNLTAKLVPRGGAPGSRFGQSVGVTEGIIVIGASGGSSGLGRGARVFERTGGHWTETAQLTLP